MPESPSPGSTQDAADPSMEDILASIRRILNDGDGGSAAAEGHEPAAHSAGQSGPDVFVLDRSMMIEEPHPDHGVQEQHAAEPRFEPLREEEEDFHPPPLLAPETADAASNAVGSLVRALHDRHMPVHRSGGPTLEDIVREEMRPLVKAWLDEHLPSLVERLVRAEIERLVGRASS